MSDIITNKATLDNIKELFKLVGVTNIEELKACIVKSGKVYTDPGSFCRKCSNLVHNHRYCGNCGLKNKYYRH